MTKPDRRDYLNPEAVRHRAEQFPRLSEIAGSRLTRLLDGDASQRVRAGARLLDLFERTGDASSAFLGWVESAVKRIDVHAPDGWGRWQGRLATADRISFDALISELAVIDWLVRHDFAIDALEPARPDGRRVDMLVSAEGEKIAIEVTTPRPAIDDWVDEAVNELFERLRRVPTGLYVDVSGFAALQFEPGGPWGEPNPPITSAQIDATINEFRAAVAGPRRNHSPPGSGCITTESTAETGGDRVEPRVERRDRDHRRLGPLGLRPDVDRLAAKLLAERAHLPEGPTMVLCDLVALADFRDAEYYLGEVAHLLQRRTRLPSAMTTFVTQTTAPDVLVERSILATSDPSAGVEDVLDAWLPSHRSSPQLL